MTSCCVRIEVFSDSRNCITIDQRKFLMFQKHEKFYVFFSCKQIRNWSKKKQKTKTDKLLKDKIGKQRLFTDPSCPFAIRIEQKTDRKINQQSPIEV